MPKNATLDAAVRNIVAEHIQSAMEPYRLILERVTALMEGSAKRRGPGRPRKAGGRRPARVGAKDAIRAAQAFKVGETVAYKQGRGTFEAKVLEIDEATGMMTVQRLSDGKKVARPATKIEAFGGEARPAKQEKPAKAPKAKKAGKRGKAKAGKAAKVDFSEGQKVVYKQGRGSFDAKIVSIDHETGTVKLQREKDGKEITRPAGKVSAAA